MINFLRRLRKPKGRPDVLFVEQPKAGEDFAICHVSKKATIVRVMAVTDVGTVDFHISNVCRGVVLHTLWLSAKTATVVNRPFFVDQPKIDANTWLTAQIVGTSSNARMFMVSVEYTIDD